jgi:flagellar motor component MotA
MTIHQPTGAHEADATHRGVATAARPTPVVARGGETKAFYKTSEFIVFIVASIAVLLASFIVKTTEGHEDYFRADTAWLYVVILSVGYMVSRGLAKSGSRHRDV